MKKKYEAGNSLNAVEREPAPTRVLKKKNWGDHSIQEGYHGVTFQQVVVLG